MTNKWNRTKKIKNLTFEKNNFGNQDIYIMT